MILGALFEDGYLRASFALGIWYIWIFTHFHPFPPFFTHFLLISTTSTPFYSLYGTSPERHPFDIPSHVCNFVNATSDSATALSGRGTSYCGISVDWSGVSAEHMKRASTVRPRVVHIAGLGAASTPHSLAGVAGIDAAAVRLRAAVAGLPPVFHSDRVPESEP